MLGCLSSLRQMFQISTKKTDAQIMLPVDTSTETTDRTFLADVQLLLSGTHKKILRFQRPSDTKSDQKLRAKNFNTKY
jgi:hypothetical protein